LAGIVISIFSLAFGPFLVATPPLWAVKKWWISQQCEMQAGFTHKPSFVKQTLAQIPHVSYEFCEALLPSMDFSQFKFDEKDPNLSFPEMTEALERSETFLDDMANRGQLPSIPLGSRMMANAKQILSRLFPVKRGLTHSYWAPNFWALYNFTDRILVGFRKILVRHEICKKYVHHLNMMHSPDHPHDTASSGAIFSSTPQSFMCEILTKTLHLRSIPEYIPIEDVKNTATKQHPPLPRRAMNSKLIENDVGVVTGTEKASPTSGLVQDVKHEILPEVKFSFTLLLMVVSMIPPLFLLWNVPTAHTLTTTIAFCAMCSFMFGWHVHEKAILIALIPLSLTCFDSYSQSMTFLIAGPTASVSIFPLLPGGLEVIIKLSFSYIHNLMLLLFLHDETRARMHSRNIAFHGFAKGMPWKYWFLSRAVSSAALLSIILPFLFPKYEFLPQMLISVTCAVANIFVCRSLWNDLLIVVQRSLVRKYKPYALQHLIPTTTGASGNGSTGSGPSLTTEKSMLSRLSGFGSGFIGSSNIVARRAFAKFQKNERMQASADTMSIMSSGIDHNETQTQLHKQDEGFNTLVKPQSQIRPPRRRHSAVQSESPLYHIRNRVKSMDSTLDSNSELHSDSETQFLSDDEAPEEEKTESSMDAPTNTPFDEMNSVDGERADEELEPHQASSYDLVSYQFPIHPLMRYFGYNTYE